MLLRSAFTTPILSFIPTKTKCVKLQRAILTNALAEQTPLPVRRNASTDTNSINPPSLLLLPKLPPKSAYIHLPFCRKRCHYCDFPIIALGSSSNQDDDPRVINYVETLCREIKAAKMDPTKNPPLETVFFGGGTPSLVPPRLVLSVLDALKSRFGVCGHAEISMEMDPGTFDAVKVKDLMNLGVNRVSLGVQAFQEELLKACGRAHGVEQVYEAIKIVKSCGVENWSLDLISSLPNQSSQMWEDSLKRAIEAQPTHVSVYDLQVEKDTKFGILYTPGEFPLPSENQAAEFYKTASEMLGDAGYDHYEISSYSKVGYRCKHNSTYWNSKSFYAFGLGSASYIDGLRFSRPRKLKEYMSYVENLENGLVNHSKDESIDAKDLAMDVIMLSLRTSDGLNLKSFRDTFGESILCSICEIYKPYVESGHIMILDEQRQRVTNNEVLSLLANEKLAFLRLSDPDGFLLSNELISLAFRAIAP